MHKYMAVRGIEIAIVKDLVLTTLT